MNKKLKLSLLGTLIASSALSITMPIVSCSSSAADGTLTVTRESNFDTKKAKVEAELDKLITTKTDAERRKEFDALNKVYNANSSGADKTTWDALVDIVTFKDGETKVDWSNAVESVSLIPGVWPTGSAPKKAPVEMKINLKPDYIVADDAALYINMNISIIAITTLTVTNANDFNAKKAKVEAELDKLITATNDDAERQKEFNALNKVYNANSVGNDKTTWDALVNIVTFKDGETPKNWIDVVESVSIVPGIWPTGNQEKEAPVKMKINLKPSYDANAATLSINMNISFAAITTLTVTKGEYYENSKTNITATIENYILENSPTNVDREANFKNLITTVINKDNFNSSINFSIWHHVIRMWDFKNGDTLVSFIDAYESISFVGAWVAGNQAKEIPLKVKIKLKPNYIADIALSFDLRITIPAITDTTLTFIKTELFENLKNIIQQKLEDYVIAAGSSGTVLQIRLKELGKMVINKDSTANPPAEIWASLDQMLDIKNGETVVNWIDVIESVSLLPDYWRGPSREHLVEIKINLKPGYIASSSALSIDVYITLP